ncbi:MAG: DUF2783 domain-containing protein [Pseudomonadota bacterium]
MTALDTRPKFDRPDDVYQMLIDAHEGLSDAESQRLNAKLILLLANHIGDVAVIEEALSHARGV